MPGTDLLLLFVEPLNRLKIPYMISGAFAAILYGVPRFTHDVDIVIELQPEQIEGLTSAFPEEEYYVPPSEVIHAESIRPARGHMNIIHHDSGFRADIYFAGDDPLQKWGLQNRALHDYKGIKVAIAPPEYVILKKLDYYREGGAGKHLADIRQMWRFVETSINRDFLEREVKRLNLQPIWQLIMEELKRKKE